MPMLWVYGLYKYFTFSVRESTLDVRICLLKSIPELKGLNQLSAYDMKNCVLFLSCRLILLNPDITFFTNLQMRVVAENHISRWMKMTRFFIKYPSNNNIKWKSLMSMLWIKHFIELMLVKNLLQIYPHSQLCLGVIKNRTNVVPTIFGKFRPISCWLLKTAIRESNHSCSVRKFAETFWKCLRNLKKNLVVEFPVGSTFEPPKNHLY